MAMAKAKSKSGKKSGYDSSLWAPPINLVEYARKLADQFNDHGFDDIDVDADIDFNSEECGRGTLESEVTEVEISFSPLSDDNYFDDSRFSEALWMGICQHLDWQGDKRDLPFCLVPLSYTEEVSDIAAGRFAGKIIVGWKTSSEVVIKFRWVPKTEVGRKELKRLHAGGKR